MQRCAPGCCCCRAAPPARAARLPPPLALPPSRPLRGPPSPPRPPLAAAAIPAKRTLTLDEQASRQTGIACRFWPLSPGRTRQRASRNAPGVHSASTVWRAAGPTQVGIGGVAGNTGGCSVGSASEPLSVRIDGDYVYAVDAVFTCDAILSLLWCAACVLAQIEAAWFASRPCRRADAMLPALAWAAGVAAGGDEAVLLLRPLPPALWERGLLPGIAGEVWRTP